MVIILKTVHIDASKSYDILIGGGILQNVGEYIKKVCPNVKKIGIITDDIVNELYADNVEQNLIRAGFETVKYVFPNGEKSKSMENLTSILNFLGENHITRSDAVVALGGGVVGDITGFAASAFLRGIRFIQIPTTLLAMVDSSVGGKTAVNLESGKNLAGAFYQPDLVICDYATLSTLKDTVFADGCAEIIKYGMISDKKLFDFISSNPIAENLESVIERCVSIKAEVVMSDERDTGIRQILNFGHTIGHAIEKCSSYEIPHGSAVAIGMVIVSKGAYLCGLCSEDHSQKIKDVLLKYSLPTSCTYSADKLFEVTLSDKKRTGSYTTLVIPEEIGKCILKKVNSDEIYDLIKKGIEA